ncbi:MAG: DUF6491 family protein [Parvularculaceae bacterium]
MVNVLKALALAGVIVASSAAIAGDPDEDGPDPRIGKGVSRICFASTIDGWKAVKGENDVVLLRKGVRDWYRVELMGACRASDFRSAMTIGIESRPAGGCVTRGDVILVRGPGDFVNRCHISKMYEWNEDAKAPQEDDGDDEDAD